MRSSNWSRRAATSMSVMGTKVMYDEPDFACVLERRADPPAGKSMKGFLDTVNNAFAPTTPAD
jgi:hypothetical protein